LFLRIFFFGIPLLKSLLLSNLSVVFLGEGWGWGDLDLAFCCSNLLFISSACLRSLRLGMTLLVRR
jgi:hypothetical protein